MASAVEDAGRRDGVWDAQSGNRLDGPLEVEEVDGSELSFPEEGAAGGHGREPFYSPPPQAPSEPVFSGKETEDEMVPHLASRSATPPAPQLMLRQPFVKIRLNADVEDMTYGMRNGEPNNYTFREGFVYEVEIEVAEHLNQRGLVGQWVPG
jgi:hypothetical protein